MDAASLEAHRLLKEKTIKDCFLEDDMDNDIEEEEGGVDCYADDERKKKVTGRRGGPGGTSPPCCVVEKCGIDLTDARRYHRRHKVCETHSKAPVVIVAGLRQRFCQQCSRYQAYGFLASVISFCFDVFVRNLKCALTTPRSYIFNIN